MPSNYDEIRQENIRRPGEEFDAIGRLISEMLYSDKSHFIYELIQNVEDALERRDRNGSGTERNNEIAFYLYEDRLELSHYGIPFDEEDVRAISYIVAGTKSEDLNQIGKFGIGFKSVYAYTSSPKIHSGNEHFKIISYIRPEAEEKIDLSIGETRIILPFNHAEVDPDEAYSQIFARLSNLSVRTLLFLRKVEAIHWFVDDEIKGSYLKKSHSNSSEGFRRTTLINRENGNILEERWLVFKKSISNIDRLTKSDVEIAYLTEGPSQKPNIVPLTSSPLYAYFPTSFETNLKFLVQGHFNTTSSRENIQFDDQWNLKLIKETADLVVDSLLELRNRKLLNVDTLRAMPIRKEKFPEGAFFHPFYSYVLAALDEHELLPTDQGDYITASDAKIARGSAMRELLGENEIKDLFNNSYRWLATDVSADRNSRLRSYLKEDLFIDEIEPINFARLLDVEFFQKRSSNWMIMFYSFLLEQRALWSTRDSVLRSKAFIRLVDGSHILPFDENGELQVFLLSEGDTEFKVVSQDITNDPKALEFLLALGIKEPNLVDEVIKNILPKYRQVNLALISEEENLNDVSLVLQAYKGATHDQRKQLHKHLQDARLIYAVNKGSGKKDYLPIKDVYFMEGALKEYLNGNADAWDLDFRYYVYKSNLIGLGLKEKIGIKFDKPGPDGYVLLSSSHGHHRRGVDGFDPDADIFGLDNALANPSIEKSRYIWNQLIQSYPHLIKGIVQRCSRKNFNGEVVPVVRVSKVGNLLLKKAWLPNNKGVFKTPSELSPEDLHEGFIENRVLAEKLGMKLADVQSAADVLGLDKNILSKFVQALNNNREEMERILDQQTRDMEYADENLVYIVEIEEAFSKIGRTGKGRSNLQPGESVPNPDRRREKIQEEIQKDQEDEPTIAKRFTRVSGRVWEKKDNQVREFLLHQYDGECQICGESFNKRNGTPYFEGLYLIPHSKKEWVDRSGNVLCLCATCCAKFQHGTVEADSIIHQIQTIKLNKEGGDGHTRLVVQLCGEKKVIKYSERHILDLQEILKSENKN